MKTIVEIDNGGERSRSLCGSSVSSLQTCSRMTCYMSISISHPTVFRTTFFPPKAYLKLCSSRLIVSNFLSSKLSLPQYGGTNS